MKENTVNEKNKAKSSEEGQTKPLRGDKIY